LTDNETVLTSVR